MIHQQEEMAMWLIARGAQLEGSCYVGSNEYTTLQTASYFGLPSTLEMLVDRGLQIDARNAIGLTPIQCVLRQSFFEVIWTKASQTKAISLLLGHGLSLSKEDLISSPELVFFYDAQLNWGWTLPAIIGERQIYCFHAGAPCSKGLSGDMSAAKRLVSTTRASMDGEVFEKCAATGSSEEPINEPTTVHAHKLKSIL